jgi:hypothetical protein
MATPFAQTSDLVLQYDQRRIGELASDTGTPIAPSAFSTNPVLLYTLARATEIVLMNARLGKRYTEAELLALAQDTLSQGIGAELRGLTCDLAFGLLVMRRGTGANDLQRLSPAFAQAQQTLRLLAQGEFVFAHTATEAQIAAGTPETANLTQLPNSPPLYDSWSQQANLGLLPISPFTRDPYNTPGL